MDMTYFTTPERHESISRNDVLALFMKLQQEHVRMEKFWCEVTSDPYDIATALMVSHRESAHALDPIIESLGGTPIKL